MRPDLRIHVTEIDRKTWKNEYPVIVTQGNITKRHLKLRFLFVRVFNSGKVTAEDCYAIAQIPSKVSVKEHDIFDYPLRWGFEFKILNVEEGNLLRTVISSFEEKTEIVQRIGKPLLVLFTVEDVETGSGFAYLLTEEPIALKIGEKTDISFMFASPTPNAGRSALNYRIIIRSVSDFDIVPITLATRLRDTFSMRH